MWNLAGRKILQKLSGVSSYGEIYRSTQEGTRRVPDKEFTRMAYGATEAVRQAKANQYEQLSRTDGQIVEWRPNHSLYGKYNMTEATGNPKTEQVFVKKGELYCPRHTTSRLTTISDHGEDRRKWLACSDIKCFFDVYIGT